VPGLPRARDCPAAAGGRGCRRRPVVCFKASLSGPRGLDREDPVGDAAVDVRQRSGAHRAAHLGPAMGGATARSRVRLPVLTTVPTALPDVVFPWTGATVSSTGLQGDRAPPRSQRETFAALASRLEAASAQVRELGKAGRPSSDVIAAAELSVRKVTATAEAMLAQFAPPEIGGLALVVPCRSHAFHVARSTNCLPAFMPSETSDGELSYVSGSGSVQSHSLGRPEADVIPDAETCTAIAMGLQLATASVTAALCDFGTSRSGTSEQEQQEQDNKRTSSSSYRKTCPTCNRVFTHPPAYAGHVKSCNGSFKVLELNRLVSETPSEPGESSRKRPRVDTS
jgi:hypothetical protein